MARETQKAKIERLEKDLKQANQIIQKLNNEIERLKKKRERKANENNLERIDQQLQDARDKADKWHKQLFIQQQKNKELEKEIEYLVEKNSIIQKHNERGAGRKNRFNEQEVETIKVMRLRGDKIKDIAEQFNCSVGLIHKLIHESEEK